MTNEKIWIVKGKDWEMSEEGIMVYTDELLTEPSELTPEELVSEQEWNKYCEIMRENVIDLSDYDRHFAIRIGRKITNLLKKLEGLK